MPQTTVYDAAAQLYLKGDRAGRVYRVVAGTAVEHYEEGMIFVSMPVRTGEWCGVTELLSGAVRLGRAMTNGPATVEAYDHDEFLRTVLHDADQLDLVLRREILLLQQLNGIAKQFMEGEAGSGETRSESFYAMGAYFTGMKRPQQALYIYRRYCELFPGGEHVEQAAAHAAELGEEMETEGVGMTADELLEKAQGREQAGDFAAAAEMYKKMLVGELPPALRISVMLRQANALQMSGKPLLALKAIKLLNGLEGLTADDRNQGLFLEGRCYELMQDAQKAALLYGQCDSGIWQQLAQARLQEMGN